MKLETGEAIRRAHWVEGYRLAHRDADRWADSPSGIHHTVETQAHVFRMADELRGRGDWPHARHFFPVLKAIDDAVRRDGDRAVPPCGLAVVPTPIQPRTPQPVPLHPAKQPAGVGR